MSAWPLGKRAPKLALRVYLLGLAQFAIVMVGMFVILTLSQRAPLEFVNTFDFVAHTIAATGGNPDQVSKVVARARTSLHCALAVYDGQGRLVARDPETPAPARRSEVKPLASDLESTVPMPDGSRWSVVFLATPPIAKPPVFWAWTVVILVGVGLFSWFIARSLARPLARLAAAAHDFGSGKVGTRVRMDRTDELGQVAAAFNRMAEQVAEALRAEKELLANVSHELRTPLQRIHIAVDLAGEGDAATSRELLRDIAEDLGELERIVEDVLAAARLSLRDGITNASASPRVRREVVEVRTLVDKAASRFRSKHPRPLRLDFGQDLPSIQADPVLLRRVFDNLLENADKYSDDPNTEVSIVTQRGADDVTIEVRDRGIGISRSDLQRVFEPFFRADRSRTRTTGGLGLGLALARRIVEAHGGALTLESTLGIGTTARVKLPVVAEHTVS